MIQWRLYPRRRSWLSRAIGGLAQRAGAAAVALWPRRTEVQAQAFSRTRG